MGGEPVSPTLPLSGRQGAWGGVADSSWWPVHSRGLFEVLTINFQLEVEEARNTMMSEVLWPMLGSMDCPFPGKPEMISLLRFCQREYLLHRTMLQITERASPLL